MVIASDNNGGTMSLKPAFLITILLISAISLAGCTGSSSAPVATPTPASVAFPGTSTPAPAGTVVPVVPYSTWTMETAATGHPYSKTFSFHGSGDYEDFTFTTDSDATWNFRMDPGQGYFMVSLKDAGNNEIAVLADGTNAGSSQKSVRLNAGNYHFDIAADSPWYITMTTP
jgi:hypothetical protein